MGLGPLFSNQIWPFQLLLRIFLFLGVKWSSEVCACSHVCMLEGNAFKTNCFSPLEKLATFAGRKKKNEKKTKPENVISDSLRNKSQIFSFLFVAMLVTDAVNWKCFLDLQQRNEVPRYFSAV